MAKTLKKAGHEIHFLANSYAGATLDFAKLEDGTVFDYKIYGELTGNSYFSGMMSQHLKETKTDVFFILLDTFMLYQTNFLNQDTSPARTIFWFPSDGGGGLPKGCENVLRKVNKPVAMSKFGKKQVKDYYNLNVDYIPHGTEPDKFFRLDDNKRKELRKKWGLDDKFVIGVVARNQPRKNLDRTIKAMNLLKDKIPNAVLFLHLDPNDIGQGIFNIGELIRKFNIENRVIFSGMKAHKGFFWDKMNEVYNLMDVFLLTTCYIPDTIVQTLNGFKTIKNITNKDLVLTHDGSYHKVNCKYKYKHKGYIRKIKPTYSKEFKCTPNHKLLILKNDKPKQSYYKKKLKQNPKLDWVPAEFIRKGDYLVYPRNKYVKDLDYTDEQLRLFGYYIAEGCLSQKKGKPEGLVFSINTKEKKLTDDIMYLMDKYYNLKGTIKDYSRNRRTIRFYSSKLGKEFKEAFNSGAKNKDIPNSFMFLPFKKQEQLIKGLWIGDGCFYYHKNKKATEIEYQTVSEKLAWRIFNILIRLGYIPSFKEQDRQSKVYSIKLAGKQKWEFCKIFNYKLKETNIGNQIGWIDKNYAYMPVISNMKEEYEGDVYDLNVDGNHTYVTSIAGHNSGEGFGIPIIEAMSCEVPVIATNYTTTQELAIDNNAGLGIDLSGVEPFDLFKIDSKQDDIDFFNGTQTGGWEVERSLCSITDTAKKIQYLYDNPKEAKQMGKNGRKAVLEKYDWYNIVGPKWLEVFNEINNL